MAQASLAPSAHKCKCKNGFFFFCRGGTYCKHFPENRWAVKTLKFKGKVDLSVMIVKVRVKVREFKCVFIFMLFFQTKKSFKVLYTGWTKFWTQVIKLLIPAAIQPKPTSPNKSSHVPRLLRVFQCVCTTEPKKKFHVEHCYHLVKGEETCTQFKLRKQQFYVECKSSQWVYMFPSTCCPAPQLH